ncbi:hypothetical protein PPTG_19085 [Phytophthora nicotianae INRA-310]|uniref:Uncharacterized protein n=1 Tax=Phytophthora nicotianae (strain INRA-310) TaxID=761204 RepID=W2PDI5_PHYN3|nr:hypothetical protein PPTG_19085 [Phytophthora nicotianae INRA-310]ETM99112.1 hypothetical protein PPTG_19085 [Phytophthora nicotianae INRA-310]
MKQRVRCLSQFSHDSNVSVGRVSDVLKEMHRWWTGLTRLKWFKPEFRPRASRRWAVGSAGDISASSSARLSSCGSATCCSSTWRGSPVCCSSACCDLATCSPQAPAVAHTPTASQAPAVTQQLADAQLLSELAPATLRSPEQGQDVAGLSPHKTLGGCASSSED